MTKSAQQERREHPRYEVTAYIDYAGTEVLLYHKVENISLGGVCIRTTDLEQVGTAVDLVISFPDLDETVATRGEVVWANHDEPTDIGIRFADLDPSRKEILRRYMDAVDSKRGG